MRDTAGFAFSQYLSRFVQLLRGVVAARLLTPAAYGSWNALLLILDYGILSQLGLQQASTRKSRARWRRATMRRRGSSRPAAWPA
jgi:O-antigen/teichoic acid export membrane protein